MRTDLVLVAELARQSVEAARQRNGVLPDAIPNPALANLVRYEVKGDEYTLVVMTAKVRVEMDAAGNQIERIRETVP